VAGEAMANLRILIADLERMRLTALRRQLTALGYQVVGEALSGPDVVSLAESVRPDLAIIGAGLADADGLAVIAQIGQSHPLPVILTAPYRDDQVLERIEQTQVAGLLFRPFSESALCATIVMALAHFRDRQALIAEIADLREALEARKVLERAKGILMRRLNLTEEEAFQRLQRQSQNSNRKLIQVAQAIVTADEMM
jgi:two-component system, response regulator PdtaR